MRFLFFNHFRLGGVCRRRMAETGRALLTGRPLPASGSLFPAGNAGSGSDTVARKIIIDSTLNELLSQAVPSLVSKRTERDGNSPDLVIMVESSDPGPDTRVFITIVIITDAVAPFK